MPHPQDQSKPPPQPKPRSTLDTLDTLDRYPRGAALRDRRRVTLRLTRPGDRIAIDALVDRLPSDDLMFARTYLTQDGLTIDWIDDADSFWTTAVVAESRGEIVGFAHLHYNPDADPRPSQSERATADIQFVVAPEYRGLGLGSLLAGECVWIVDWLQLPEVQARVTSGQPAARAVFERLGFLPVAMLQDGAVTARGRPRHILLMRRTTTTTT